MAEQKQQLQQVMAQALGQLQMELQQSVIQNLTKTCFERCVSAPVDGRLADKQRRCLDACASSYLEGFQISVSGRWHFCRRRSRKTSPTFRFPD